MKFNYIERGYKDSIVLIPGWGADLEIFRDIDIQFNYITPVNFHPFSFAHELSEYIKLNAIKEISIFGWSMGGFCASRFLLKYKKRVSNLILVSIRKKYKPQEIAEAKKQLISNKEAYQKFFYRQCFSGCEKPKPKYKSLFNNYCEMFSAQQLLGGLEFLEKSQIKPGCFNYADSVTVVHGSNDSIAPIDEAKSLCSNSANIKFLEIKNTGHMPFLQHNFKKIL